jgi:hypothetical protein
VRKKEPKKTRSLFLFFILIYFYFILACLVLSYLILFIILENRRLCFLEVFVKQKNKNALLYYFSLSLSLSHTHTHTQPMDVKVHFIQAVRAAGSSAPPPPPLHATLLKLTRQTIVARIVQKRQKNALVWFKFSKVLLCIDFYIVNALGH